MNEVRRIFLDSCAVVLSAVSDERVASKWTQPSVLDGQTVGAVAAHVARGSWVVRSYLDEGVPDGPATFSSAADYFAKLMEAATPEMHEGIRQRGADGAADGPETPARLLKENLDALDERLTSEPEDRLISVYGGNVMMLDDYLATRLTEQVVHLDDLARSVAIDPWTNAEGAEELVLSVGVDVGRARFGGAAVVHSLFRGAGAGPLAKGVMA